MSKKYIVHWQHKYNPTIAGHGNPVNKITAESWVKHGDKDAPFLFHWIAPVDEWRDYPPHSPAG
jgi:hypothetical protein